MFCGIKGDAVFTFFFSLSVLPLGLERENAYMMPWSYRVVGRWSKGVREGGKARTVMMRFFSTSGFFAGFGWGCFLSSARKRQKGRGEEKGRERERAHN